MGLQPLANWLFLGNFRSLHLREYFPSLEPYLWGEKIRHVFPPSTIGHRTFQILFHSTNAYKCRFCARHTGGLGKTKMNETALALMVTQLKASRREKWLHFVFAMHRKMPELCPSPRPSSNSPGTSCPTEQRPWNRKTCGGAGRDPALPLTGYGALSSYFSASLSVKMGPQTALHAQGSWRIQRNTWRYLLNIWNPGPSSVIHSLSAHCSWA